MQPLIKAGDILRGLVRDPGNRVSVVEEFLRGVGDAGAMAFIEETSSLDVRFVARRSATMLHNLEHLPFYDATDSIQIGATFAFDVVGIHRLASQPKNYTYSGQHGEADHRNQIMPIGEEVSQRKYINAA